MCVWGGLDCPQPRGKHLHLNHFTCDWDLKQILNNFSSLPFGKQPGPYTFSLSSFSVKSYAKVNGSCGEPLNSSVLKRLQWSWIGRACVQCPKEDFFPFSLKRTHGHCLPQWRMQHCLLGPGAPGPAEKWLSAVRGSAIAPRFLVTSAAQFNQLCFSLPLCFERALESQRSAEFIAISSRWLGQVVYLLQASVSFPVNWRLKIVPPIWVPFLSECFIFVLTTRQFITPYYSLLVNF